jgi:hypothetical protein
VGPVAWAGHLRASAGFCPICLRARCGHRSVPPKHSFPGCLGGTRLSAYQWRTAKTCRHHLRAIVDLALLECLNTTVSPQSNPRQRAFPLPFLLIFESSPTHLAHLLSSLSPKTHNIYIYCHHNFEAEEPHCNYVFEIHPQLFLYQRV